MAVDELLHHARRCAVVFGRMFDQLECVAELGMQRVWRVPHDGQAAALQRAHAVDTVSMRLLLHGPDSWGLQQTAILPVEPTVGPKVKISAYLRASSWL